MDNPEKYKKIFLIEAGEKITALNTAFIGLEKEPGSSTFANDAMRASHTLKSSAAAMNFMQISHLAHAMEDVFEEVRTKKHRLPHTAIETLFSAVDMLSTAILAVKKGKSEPSTEAMIDKLALISAKSKATTAIGGVPPKGGKIPVLSEVEGSNPKPNEGMILAQKPEDIAPIEAIKVDVTTLDDLMNLTEELLVERMRFAEIMRIAKGKSNESLNRAELESSSESFDRLISELQLNVTKARMVPLGQIFERFPRLVRDLAHDQGKDVEFTITGQDIELDRTVIDRLGEPLIQNLYMHR